MEDGRAEMGEREEKGLLSPAPLLQGMRGRRFFRYTLTSGG